MKKYLNLIIILISIILFLSLYIRIEIIAFPLSIIALLFSIYNFLQRK